LSVALSARWRFSSIINTGDGRYSLPHPLIRCIQTSQVYQLFDPSRLQRAAPSAPLNGQSHSLVTIDTRPILQTNSRPLSTTRQALSKLTISALKRSHIAHAHYQPAMAVVTRCPAHTLSLTALSSCTTRRSGVYATFCWLRSFSHRSTKSLKPTCPPPARHLLTHPPACPSQRSPFPLPPACHGPHLRLHHHHHL